MRSAVLALVACLGVLEAPRAAHAQGIYSYVDKDGTVVFTNVPPSGASPSGQTSARKTGAGKANGPSKATPAAASEPRHPVQRLSTAQFDAYIETAARKYNLPPALLRAVMHTESAFNPTAVSPVGAQGLMQLMPATAAAMYVRDAFDIRENIEGGARYLRVLANQYEGDMVKMVAAYNAGPEAVRKHGGIPPFAETQAYVRRVVDLYFKYKEQAKQPDKGEGAR